jgi:uncharacterized protein involved in exopolysaccharide biosynthesis
MNGNEIVQDEDSISLFDVWEKLRDGWRYVLGGAVLGIMIASLAIVIVPAKYEALAVVQVGLLGQVGKGEVVGQPVEPPSQALERMKTAAFHRRVAEALGDQEWLDDIQRTGETSQIVFQLVKATAAQQMPLIELRARGGSVEAARKRAEAAIAQLIGIHGELAKPALNRLRSDLAITREKLAAAERDLAVLNKLVSAASVRDDRFTQLALMTSLRVQKESETYDQRQMVMALETALEAPATQPAKAIEGVFVSDRPISPKKALLLALGLVGGLLAGVVVVFLKTTGRGNKKGE